MEANRDSGFLLEPFLRLFSLPDYQNVNNTRGRLRTIVWWIKETGFFWRYFFILKSDYICSVKFKKITAFILIFVVILSSIGFCGWICSQDSYATKVQYEQSATSTQLIAHTPNASHEFRETTEVTLSFENTSQTPNSISEISQLSFRVIHWAQYDSYSQRQLFQRPSSRLFLDLGSLII